MGDAMRRVAEGSVCGGVATVAMSGAMLGARRTGLVSELPPEKITGLLLRKASVHPDEKQQDALSAALHLAFGAAAGGLFRLLHDRLRAPVPAAVQGVLFAGTLWFVSYMGWIPALGLLPPSSRDEPGRATTMVLAHGIFGAVLGALVGGARAPEQ